MTRTIVIMENSTKFGFVEVLELVKDIVDNKTICYMKEEQRWNDGHITFGNVSRNLSRDYLNRMYKAHLSRGWKVVENKTYIVDDAN